MTMQEWKAKINGFFQPKSQAERQKMMKYLVVFPAAVLCGIVILWLLYTSLNKSDNKVGNAFNTEIPAGENDGIKTKAEEYAAADAAKEKEAQQRAVVALDTLTANTVTDTVAHQSAVENSAQAYQEVQASLNDFFVEDTPTDNVEMDALNERIAELEAQNAMAQQQARQSNDTAMLERSYQLRRNTWAMAIPMPVIRHRHKWREMANAMCNPWHRSTAMWCRHLANHQP